MWENTVRPEYYISMYQQLYGKDKNLNVSDIDFSVERTDGDLYISLIVIINGEESILETLSFSEMFGFEKIKGVAFTFDNTGPALRYANTLIWHPVFEMSNEKILNYFASEIMSLLRLYSITINARCRAPVRSSAFRSPSSPPALPSRARCATPTSGTTGAM